MVERFNCYSNDASNNDYVCEFLSKRFSKQNDKLILII